MKRFNALAGAALVIIASNAVALAGIAYNRSAQPDSELRLTERELPLARRDWLDNDNSGIDVRIDWRVRSASAIAYGYGRALETLGPAQMEALGFDVSKAVDAIDAHEHYARQPARAAFFVLEFDGPAYQQALVQARLEHARAVRTLAADPASVELQQRLEAAQRELHHEEISASRLFVVDAGTNAAELRARHADRGRYAIVRGRIAIDLERSAPPRLVARIAELDNELISVPHAHRGVVAPLVDPIVRDRVLRKPRYETTVRFGRRLEPWMIDMRAL